MARLGYAYALAGRLAEGRALLEDAIREFLRTGTKVDYAPVACAWHSEICVLAGHVDEAMQHAGQALALARQHGTRGFEAFALCQLGTVHAQADPPDVPQSAARYQEALALADALGMRPLQAHCHYGLGTLYEQRGCVEPTRTELATAIELYRAMGMTFWLPQAEAALAQVRKL
jgi:tetratricopeptide (TPR) repeat protein